MKLTRFYGQSATNRRGIFSWREGPEKSFVHSLPGFCIFFKKNVNNLDKKGGCGIY
jgi:hypothetical protein